MIHAGHGCPATRSFKAMFNGGTRKRVAAAAAAAGIAVPGHTAHSRPHLPPPPGSSPPPTPLSLLQSPPQSSRTPTSAPAEKRLKSDSRERKSSSSVSSTPTTLPYIPRFHSIESLAASSANNNSVEKVRPPKDLIQNLI